MQSWWMKGIGYTVPLMMTVLSNTWHPSFEKKKKLSLFGDWWEGWKCRCVMWMLFVSNLSPCNGSDNHFGRLLPTRSTGWLFAGDCLCFDNDKLSSLRTYVCIWDCQSCSRSWVSLRYRLCFVGCVMWAEKYTDDYSMAFVSEIVVRYTLSNFKWVWQKHVQQYTALWICQYKGIAKCHMNQGC